MTALYSECGWLPFGWSSVPATNAGTCGTGTSLREGVCEPTVAAGAPTVTCDTPGVRLEDTACVRDEGAVAAPAAAPPTLPSQVIVVRDGIARAISSLDTLGVASTITLCDRHPERVPAGICDNLLALQWVDREGTRALCTNQPASCETSMYMLAGELAMRTEWCRAHPDARFPLEFGSIDGDCAAVLAPLPALLAQGTCTTADCQAELVNALFEKTLAAPAGA